MEHTSNHPGNHPGGSLNLAVDRLDRALEALEARVRALQSGEPLPAFTSGEATGVNDEYDRVLAELEEARISNAELAVAATEAHAALGAAAANIRQMLNSEAA